MRLIPPLPRTMHGRLLVVVSASTVALLGLFSISLSTYLWTVHSHDLYHIESEILTVATRCLHRNYPRFNSRAMCYEIRATGVVGNAPMTYHVTFSDDNTTKGRSFGEVYIVVVSADTMRAVSSEYLPALTDKEVDEMLRQAIDSTLRRGGQ